jgi:hypothetical protein
MICKNFDVLSDVDLQPNATKPEHQVQNGQDKNRNKGGVDMEMRNTENLIVNKKNNTKHKMRI